VERALKLPKPLAEIRPRAPGRRRAGPTASGKTALALEIARRFHGEIVNCDSVAMYREFEIGTAKPSAAERAEIPHHLLDCVDPLADVSAGEYARQARQVLREIVLREIALRESEHRKHLPIVSGGTGLYLRALLEGLFPGPERSEELRNKLRSRAEKHGPGHLHRILRRLDAAAANRIHANDVPKVIRAIEVCLASQRTSRPTSRQTMTELWRQGREPLRGFRILRLGLNPERKALYARINQRAAKMFDDGLPGGGLIAGGLIAETERLLKNMAQARPLASLGYKQALQFLRGEVDRKSALAAAQQAHRNYAKRQITWFRQEPDVHWLAGFGDDPAIQAESIALIELQI
jgi:tRNA dimethylallyltransferase